MAGRQAFGSVRKKRSGRYQARYRDNRGRDHYRTFNTSAEAHRFLSMVRTDLARGEWLDPNLGRITVAEWAELFMASKRDIRPGTRELYCYLLRCHILPTLGPCPLVSVTPEDVDEWLNTLRANPLLSSTTENRAFRLLAQMFKQAVRYRRIPASPCEHVAAPKDATREMLFLGPPQVAALAAELGRAHLPYRTLVLLAAYGGLRWGECAGLAVRHVDPVRCTVRVERQLHRDGRIDAPKSAAGTRTVKLPRWLAEEVAGTIAARQPAADLCEAHTDLVLLTPEGQSLRHSSNFHGRFWRPAVTGSLPPELHKLRFHDLRHTAVAIAIDAAAKAGEPLNAKALQERMGHSTIRLTLDRYGHLLEGHDDAMIEGMVNPFEQSAVG